MADELVPKSVRLTQRQWDLLERLADTTLYGTDGADVARRFLVDRLREIIGSGELQRAEKCAEDYLGKKPAKKAR